MHTGLRIRADEELLHDMRLITEPVACVMFDLNNLKKVNGTFSRRSADFQSTLQNFTQGGSARKDFVGRYGGDEFY